MSEHRPTQSARYAVYELDTGKILRTGSCMRQNIPRKARPGLGAMEIPPDTPHDADMFMQIIDNQLVEPPGKREEMRAARRQEGRDIAERARAEERRLERLESTVRDLEQRLRALERAE